MRRNVRDRVSRAGAVPHLRFGSVHRASVTMVGCRGLWMRSRFQTAIRTRRHYRLGNDLINYMRNSVKVVIDAYDGTTTFYVFDTEDPIIAAYRGIFPTLFKDAATMPAGLRKHVRYPEMLLKLQADSLRPLSHDGPGGVL